MYDRVLAFCTTFSARHIVAHLFTDRLNVLLLTHHLQLLLHGLRLGNNDPEDNVNKHNPCIDVPAEMHILKQTIQREERDYTNQIHHQRHKKNNTRYPGVNPEVGSHPAADTAYKAVAKITVEPFGHVRNECFRFQHDP